MPDQENYGNDEVVDSEDQTTNPPADAEGKGGDIKLLRARADKASALEQENALLKLGVNTEQPNVQLFMEAKGKSLDFGDLDAVKAEMTKYGILSADGTGGDAAGAGQGHEDQAAHERVSQASGSGAPVGTVSNEPDWGSMQTAEEVIAAVQAQGGQVIYEASS